ncbi:MAG: murein hydrolase activator EnvC family protein [Pseudohongiellaceae bacterium]
MSRQPAAIKPALVLLAVLAASFSIAQDDEPSQATLAALVDSIREIQANILSRRSQRESVFSQLQESEQRLAELNNDKNRLELSVQDNEEQMSALENERRNLQRLKSGQQQLLGQYIRSSYKSGRQEYFKFLLNQENPSLASRNLRYYSYFYEARSKKVEEYTNTLEALQSIEVEINAANTELQNQKNRLENQSRDLNDKVNERKTLLNQIDILLTSSARRLEALEADRIEMERLIEELQLSIANLSLEGQQHTFQNLKGSLIWPVKGAVINSWGSNYGLGDLSWQGITISAENGSDVRAVHHGRVVFADWFSSSGLLLIIDLGGGYMSLYAHNKALFRDVGEWVNSGDIIASVGNTGGQQEYGLYFEIRYNGESENPSGWLMARN